MLQVSEESNPEPPGLQKQTHVESDEKSSRTIIRATKFISNISKSTLRNVKNPAKRKEGVVSSAKLGTIWIEVKDKLLLQKLLIKKNFVVHGWN